MPPANVVELAGKAPDGGSLRAKLSGEDMASGKQVVKTVELPLGSQTGDGVERLAKQAGLALRNEDDKVYVDDVAFGSYAEKQQIGFDWELTSVQVAAQRPPKELFYIPALLLLGLVCWLQRGRRQPEVAQVA